MPRFYLREVGPTDYRSSLPEKDPNNAIWPRISAFAKMLHDISWEDKPVDEDEVRMASDTAAEDMAGYESNGTSDAERQMEGYKPNTEEQNKEMMADETQRRVNGNYTGGTRSKDSADFMARQAAIAAQNDEDFNNFIMNFDPKTASKEDIRKMQRIIAPADAQLSDPDANPKRGDFDDSIWGKNSLKAFEDYKKQWGY